MKKLLFILSMLCLFTVAKAQVRVGTTKTVSATDTTVLTNVPDGVVSIQYTYVETSGASAGKVYIEGTIDGIAWKHVDSSLSVSDVTTAQSVHIAVTATTYRNYRARFTNTSSATGTIYFNALTRTDDRGPSPAPMPAALHKRVVLLAVLITGDSKYIHAPVFYSQWNNRTYRMQTDAFVLI